MKILTENLIVCGDTHGSFKSLVFEIERYQLSDTTVVVAGDSGLGFHKPLFYKGLFKQLDRKLKKRNVTILLMRGNHDDPLWFTEDRPDIESKKIKVVPDNTVLEWGEERILCIGGAISVDRYKRRVGVTYWRDEIFVFNPFILDKIEKVNYVITHSSPSFCKPSFKGDIVHDWVPFDSKLLADLDIERYNHNELYDYLTVKRGFKIKEWHYGHFHFSNTEFINDTKFVLHDIDEFKEIR